MQEIATV